LEWSRRRLAWTLLAAVVVLVGTRWVLASVIDSDAAEGLLIFVYLAGGLAALYVTFSWAREHDRRNPRR
jgi:hypothetical protein